jgi:hypothetical protein
MTGTTIMAVEFDVRPFNRATTAQPPTRARSIAAVLASPCASPQRLTRLVLHAAPQGGVVVAADSRTSTGSYIANRTSDKLTPVAERATLLPLPPPSCCRRSRSPRMARPHCATRAVVCLCCPGIYTCRSGSAADTQAISDYVRLYLSHYTSDTGKEPSVKVAAHLFKSMCYNNKDRLTAGIICGGESNQLAALSQARRLAACRLAVCSPIADR